MKLHILSDLHLEFHSFELPETDADVLILAGDTSTKKHGLKWILDQKLDIPVIYVLGNHEYYGDKLPRLSEKLKEMAEGTNVHVLENDHVEIGGYHFYGCTLWTDMQLFEDHEKCILESRIMNDYRKIRNSRSYSKLIPSFTASYHQTSLRKMKAFLSEVDPRKSVVVTHHGVSMCSLPEHRRKEYVSAAYTSNLDKFIREEKPLVWIHGHIHHPNQYEIGDTKIIMNPRGNPYDLGRDFDPELVVNLKKFN